MPQGGASLHDNSATGRYASWSKALSRFVSKRDDAERRPVTMLRQHGATYRSFRLAVKTTVPPAEE
jgi:hypothetical protein